MSEISARPRIYEESKLSLDEIKDRFTKNVLEYEEELNVSLKGNHITITVDPKIDHFWSPQATLNIEELEEVRITRGVIGPRPTLWATFMVIYFAGIAGFLITAVIGASLISMGKTKVVLFLAPVFLVVILVTYIASITGKKMGSDQTEVIKTFIHESLK